MSPSPQPATPSMKPVSESHTLMSKIILHSRLPQSLFTISFFFFFFPLWNLEIERENLGWVTLWENAEIFSLLLSTFLLS